MMPGVDGLELTRRLRNNPATSAMPIIMLTAKGQTVDKVIGLTAGADDYVLKPFDTMELVARIRSMLRRTKEIRESSPLTGLPGNNRILQEVQTRAANHEAFAVGHIDIDRFKTVNDAYGFARGDEFIAALAECLQNAADAIPTSPRPFIGHIGGDDFVLVCTPEQVKPLTAPCDPRVPGRGRRHLRPDRRAAWLPADHRSSRQHTPRQPRDDLHRREPVDVAGVRRPARGARGRLRDEVGRQDPTRLVRGHRPAVGRRGRRPARLTGRLGIHPVAAPRCPAVAGRAGRELERIGLDR